MSGARRLQLSKTDRAGTFPSSNQKKITGMATNAEAVSSGEELFKNSNLYREFQAEREEILKHKWIESEKAGYDIGFERALTDWIVKHRSKWRKSRQSIQRH